MPKGKPSKRRAKGKTPKPSGPRRIDFDAGDPTALLSALKTGGKRTRILLAGGAAGDRDYAALRLANEVGAPLLELPVTKFIGETEKNLAAILKRAEKSKAVLLFDEADALFTRRGAARKPGSKAGRNAALLLEAVDRARQPLIFSTAASGSITRILEALCDVCVSFGGRTPGAKADGDRPLLPQHFRVCIGERELDVCSAGPLTSESAVTPSGEPMMSTHKAPQIVLRRAVGTCRYLYGWRQAILDGKDDRREVRIHLLTAPDGPVAATWKLTEAWPVRWSGPDLDSLDQGVAMEETELRYDRILWL